MLEKTELEDGRTQYSLDGAPIARLSQEPGAIDGLEWLVEPADGIDPTRWSSHEDAEQHIAGLAVAKG